MTSSQQTCFANGLVDNVFLLCRTFTTKLPQQVCYDKLISRKIKLAAVYAIWDRRDEVRSNLTRQEHNKFAEATKSPHDELAESLSRQPVANTKCTDEHWIRAPDPTARSVACRRSHSTSGTLVAGHRLR
ncbi:hypothetical protein AVEN_244402-1 [Araneus ventricosus]|uniref:Uncharacterized protein n=1 Tax=Araneus ventricosus TaxID=182803 RepID=A0A4Y2IMB4_ARAVE|nr:hypothetical protein AVEN_244402-1 [Araneus ventricosus]